MSIPQSRFALLFLIRVEIEAAAATMSEKPTLVRKLQETSNAFREHSTIHGVGYIRLKRIGVLLYFLAVICGAASLLFYEGYGTIWTYLQYDVSTTISYQRINSGNRADPSSIGFPAISICNNNQMMRSVVGFNELNYVSAILGIYDMVNMPLPTALSFASTLCQTQAPPPELAQYGGGIGPYLLNNGYASLLKLMMPSSLNSVVDCRWMGAPLNCTQLFLNRMTMSGNCFTFNPNPNYVNSWPLLEYATNLNATMQAAAFGINKTILSSYEFNVSAAGPKSGFEVVLNVNPYDYCTGNIQQAYGFAALAHENDLTPNLIFSPLIELAAGYRVNVAVSITQITRNTATLPGHECTDTQKLKYQPSLKKYNQDECRIECLSLAFIQTCNCTPYFAPPLLLVPGILDSELCGMSFNPTAIACENAILNSNLGDYPSLAQYKTIVGIMYSCSCPQQCTETNYEVFATMTPIHSPAVLQTTLSKYAQQSINTSMSISDFKKSYIIANFYLNDLKITSVYEGQAITLSDLINQIGGAFGLFLGGSIISIIEILFFACYSIRVPFAQRIHRRNIATFREF